MTRPTSGRVPRVSIGLPAYNAEEYLEQTVESLLAQTYEDIEITICDNASTDGTAAIAAALVRRDSRVHYVRNPKNLGAAGNYTRCVELARGELFRWSSADDPSAPTFVERCVEVLDADPDVVQAYPRSILIDDQGREIEKYDDPIEALHERARDRYMHVMRHLGLVNALYGVIRTAPLRRTHHGSYLAADTVLQAEIALYGKLKEVPEYLFFRRMHGHAFSAMAAETKQAFYTPDRPKPQRMRSWRELRGRLSSVWRSPLPAAEKALLSASILRYAAESRENYLEELWVGAREAAAARRR